MIDITEGPPKVSKGNPDIDLSSCIDNTETSLISEDIREGSGIFSGSFGVDRFRASTDKNGLRGSDISSSIQEEIHASILEPAKDLHASRAMAEMTVNKLRFKSLGLVGRTSEKELLVERLHYSIQHKTREIFLICGVSGIGKTAVAVTLAPKTHRQNGLFIYGKFDLYLRDEPYAGISTACRDLCENLLLLKDPNNVNTLSFSVVSQEIIQGLGAELPLLVNIIPELEEVVGSSALLHQQQQQEQTMSLEEKKNSIGYAFRRFFRIICSLYPCLVICLDDLQWSDLASLDLLELLLADEGISNFLVLACYRSNEVNETHRLAKMIGELKTKNLHSLHISELTIGNLDVNSTCQMLADLLSQEQDNKEIIGLAEICHRKTMGNPFFLVQFISYLHRLGLLHFSMALFKWTWDNHDINDRAASTDNVKDLLVAKMESLPPYLDRLLAVLACMGSNFQRATVSLVWDCYNQQKAEKEQQSSSLESLLASAVELGFLDTMGSSRYCFIHDQLQAVSIAVIDDPHELATLKTTIGNILVDEGDGLEEYLFVAVNLLNEGLLPKDISTKIQLAKLNLEAAEAAVESSAFASASKYASKGIDLLPSSKWSDHHELTLLLHSLCAEVELTLGNMDSMERHCKEIMDQKTPLQDKFRVYNALQITLTNTHKCEESITLTRSVLKKLGCRFPNSHLAVQLSTLHGLIKTRMGVKKQTRSEMMDLPILKDPHKLEIMHLLDRMVTTCYYITSPLLPLAILKSYHFTLNNGICSASPPAFATMALLLCAAFDDFAAATRLADCAIVIMERLNCRSTFSRTKIILFMFVHCWQNPYQSAMKPLLNGYHDGLATGDTESAMWCVFHYIGVGFQSGRNLALLIADSDMYSKQMGELKLTEIQKSTEIYKWSMLEISGAADRILSDDYKAYDGYNSLSQMLKVGAKSEHIRLTTFFGEYARAADLALEMGDEFKQTLPGIYWNMSYACYSAVAAYAVAREGKGRKYKRLAKKYHTVIRSWVKKGNPNSLHVLHLLDAECAALKGKQSKAESLYQKAVATAARGGFVQDAGLSAERSARFLFYELNDPAGAKFRFQDSIRFYSDWGASRKVGMLEEECLCIFKGNFTV